MADSETIRCRVAACRERRLDFKSWSFYLINDGEAPLDWAVLHRVDYEWGDMGSVKKADVCVTNLSPGSPALVWRDDDGCAEVRVTLSLRVCARSHEVPLVFEFPKLYLIRNMELVEGLGKPGLQVLAEARPAVPGSSKPPRHQT